MRTLGIAALGAGGDVMVADGGGFVGGEDGEEYIAGFEIAVNDSFAVDVLESV